MNNTNSSTLLDHVQIASPCPVSWESMTGDDRTRFCGQCKLSVYNIREFSAKEAEDLIIQNAGQVCLRLYRRKDGTVLTKDCPVGLAKVRKRLAKTAALIIGCIASIAASFGVGISDGKELQKEEEGDRAASGGSRCYEIPASSKLVTIRDVKAGEQFRKEDFEVQYSQDPEVPLDAFPLPSVLPQYKSKIDLPKGTTVTWHHVRKD